MDNSSNDNDLIVQNTINLFPAKNLLNNTNIMAQVLQLRDKLSRDSEDDLIGYDDMYLRIRSEVNALPSLALDTDVASGAEGAYHRQLLHALEKINDDCDRVVRKLIKLKSRLMNAKSLMANQCSQFSAFYALVVPTAIQVCGYKLKLSAKHIEEIAKSEFSILMDNLDNLVPSLINELAILEEEIKRHKKSQSEKYILGKDQVNSAWTSIQGKGNGISLDEKVDRLLVKSKLQEIEDWDEMPAYTSQHTKEERLAGNPSLSTPSMKVAGVEDVEISFKKKIQPAQEPYDEYCLLDTDCAVCGERQFNTPSGETCKNGHGGASGVLRIKGTFVKTGDPKPVITAKQVLEDVKANYKGNFQTSLDTKCPTCGERQFETQDGVTCSNGHTGVIGTPRVVTAFNVNLDEDWLRRVAENEPGGIMACSPEILAASGGDVNDHAAISATAFEMMKADVATMAEIEAMPVISTPAPTTPRRKLILLDDEDVL